MRFTRLCILLILPFVFSCMNKTGNNPSENIDSIATNAEEGNLTVYFMDDYDWTPKEFKTEHPDEWTVVNRAINIQQRGRDIDFGEIDTLVKDYLVKKQISLPADVDKQIRYIEEVCSTKFDISNYDDSNRGMHIADGTNRLFCMYINWLYEQEAIRALGSAKTVDIEREKMLYKNLNDAMYDVCDSVTLCMEGSGGWCGTSQIHYLSIDYAKSMWQAVIGAKFDQKKELDVPLELFDAECKALNEYYAPYREDQQEDVSHIVNRFKSAFHSWYAYRKSVASGLKDDKFKQAYESITYGNARIYFIHLKNRFNDIGGMISNEMVEHCLDYDCSDNELLEFNYEAKWED